ncbi:MAG: hypothetical protein RLZZ381_145 [Cyanobacteriota bacterium]|jgi:hypothetical protein
MMYRYLVATVATALTGFSALALFITITSNSASAQPVLNFNELNQSRQFFEEGNELIEREIKWLQQNVKLPNIKLPQDHFQSQTSQGSYSLYAKAKLKPITLP